jgi:hypothetical protein
VWQKELQAPQNPPTPLQPFSSLAASTELLGLLLRAPHA